MALSEYEITNNDRPPCEISQITTIGVKIALYTLDLTLSGVPPLSKV
jgi:hypothetical protein